LAVLCFLGRLLLHRQAGAECANFEDVWAGELVCGFEGHGLERVVLEVLGEMVNRCVDGGEVTGETLRGERRLTPVCTEFRVVSVTCQLSGSEANRGENGGSLSEGKVAVEVYGCKPWAHFCWLCC
jgi:hypothetical protein